MRSGRGLDKSLFEDFVATTVEQLGAAALEEQVRKSASEFWKSLVLSGSSPTPAT